MPLNLVPLVWDSEHFQLSIGRVVDGRDADTPDASSLHDYDCVYWLHNTPDPPAEGFRLVDERVTLAVRPTAYATQPHVRPANSQDRVAVEAIASRSHDVTRFFSDRRFDCPASTTSPCQRQLYFPMDDNYSLGKAALAA